METMQAQKTVRIIPAKPEFAKPKEERRQLRTAAYCRVSTEKDEQQLSFEHQCDYYTDKIMSNPELTLVSIYSDEGISGTSATKRPGFMKMIRHCKEGKIDLIITKSTQRFARNTLDALKHTRLLKSMGIGIIFETQGIDTRKTISEFMLTVHFGMAQAESENISANVKWGKRKSAKGGNVAISYKSFLGYRKGLDGKPEIDPEQAIIVTRIYDNFLAGRSFQDIADGLTADGIPTPMGKGKWRSEVIKSILKQEKYCGDAVLQKTYIEDCISHKSKINQGELPMYYVTDNHPAIIEKPVWNRVQEELARRSGKRKVKEIGTKTEQGKYSSKYALTELLCCGHCGTPYRRCTWSKNGKKKIVWRCISRLDYGKKYCQESVSVEESVIQSAILDAIKELALTDSSALEVLKMHIGMALSGEVGEGDTFAMQTRIIEIDRTIGELIVLEAGDGNQGNYDNQIAALYSEKTVLKEKIEQVQNSKSHDLAEQSRLSDIFTIVDGLKDRPLEWDESIIRQMISCVKVLGKDRIKIFWRLGGECEVKL
ncbi:MAG: recombinase family protein [Oscillospiraceae bacterium]|jgi:DNA invertase Pin-like site-specific DNA recombinase|nr:recombinase family protein [Oscillospiraceae bacterium]